MTWRDDTCGEHQPSAAAPAPEADAAFAEVEAQTMRTYADHPASSGLTPVHPDRLRRWADLIDALSATPPRPAMDPETRQVLEDAAFAISVWSTEYGRDTMTHLAGVIRAHIAAHGGGDE
jgi:hypothetical protein